MGIWLKPASVSSYSRVWAKARKCEYFCEVLGQISMIRDDEFRLLFEAAPNGMIVADQAGAIVFVNAQTEKLFGYLRGELVGQAVELLIPERFRTTHAALRDQFKKIPSRDRWGRDATSADAARTAASFRLKLASIPFIPEIAHW
jgi:PAS domain-containing protein